MPTTGIGASQGDRGREETAARSVSLARPRFLKLGLPLRDLVRVHVEMLSQLRQRHLALDRG